MFLSRKSQIIIFSKRHRTRSATSSQCNLLDRMLRSDANKIFIKDQCLQSIHSWDSGSW